MSMSGFVCVCVCQGCCAGVRMLRLAVAVVVAAIIVADLSLCRIKGMGWGRAADWRSRKQLALNKISK